MLAWISENYVTVLVLLVLTGVVAAIVAGMIHSRKKGGSSCGCHCAGCAMSGSCHKAK